VALADDLERIAGLAAAHAGEGDTVSGILATEPSPGERVYVCSFDGADGYRAWLAVRDDGSPVAGRGELRAAVSIAALCEVAAEAAAGGNPAELVARLEEVRERDAPEGIEAAIAAAQAVAEVVGEPPQLATPARLDAIGTATRELERELDPVARSPFSAAMQSAQAAVAELQREVEAGYRIALV
jgi:hypothetical protein